MDRITLKNYRCFGSEEQSARLAPLTLLVGPNSTGKTSFLALIRALWDVAFREVVPNFREHPYDLGSWDDIVYDPGGNRSRAEQFCTGFEYHAPLSTPPEMIVFATIFAPNQTVPIPIMRQYGDERVEVRFPTTTSLKGEPPKYRVGRDTWHDLGESAIVSLGGGLPPLEAARTIPMVLDEHRRNDLFDLVTRVRNQQTTIPRPFASSPTRSRPRRTYDPSLLMPDAEGDYVPSYLANLARRNPHEWQLLKDSLEKFGQTAELFDEINIRSFGKSDGDPFQIQIRKYSGPAYRRRKGPWRNLADVGYGVSQILPILTEMLRLVGAWKFLLQQPEVHLHPQAQAALGTLFCEVAASNRQVIIETHSDYIIDRVRMDVRDGTTGLRPEDVSILYFEPGDMAVKIHSIGIDKAGNVLDAPLSYGNFFMEEVDRSIGLRKG